MPRSCGMTNSSLKMCHSSAARDSHGLSCNIPELSNFRIPSLVPSNLSAKKGAELLRADQIDFVSLKKLATHDGEKPVEFMIFPYNEPNALERFNRRCPKD